MSEQLKKVMRPFVLLLFLQIIWMITNYFLILQDLRPRAWVSYAFILVCLSFLFYFLLRLIKFLFQFSIPSKGLIRNNYYLMILKNTVILALMGAVVMVSGFLFLFAVFTYEPEYVVEKYGRKLLAEVDDSSEITVDYYSYKNSFVSGLDRIGWETYPSSVGGFATESIRSADFFLLC